MNRKQFVDYWATFLLEHPKEAWNSHKNFINMMMANAKNYPFDAKEYLLKKKKCIDSRR